MAKTKPQDRGRKSKKAAKAAHAEPKQTPEALLAQAMALLHTSQPEEALVLARNALSLLQGSTSSAPTVHAALNLLGEINVERGDVPAARENFLAAVSLDPEGQSHEGAEKFLWLAQLCEQGGAESVKWFRQGVDALRREIGQLEEHGKRASDAESLEEKKRKMSGALCGIAEVYMTDLSWETDAEAQCEAAVTEALLVAPNNPEPLQTLASIRISQERIDDARASLTRSISLWKDLDPADPNVPDFPTRISLSRLLMEVEMEEDATEVLERLIAEDDQSVEAWYLGGWCLHLLGEKQGSAMDDKTALLLRRASRDWLHNCLKLYAELDYEDERLKEHAEEIMTRLDKILGPATAEDDAEWDDTEGESEDEDEDEDGAEDEEMAGT